MRDLITAEMVALANRQWPNGNRAIANSLKAQLGDIAGLVDALEDLIDSFVPIDAGDRNTLIRAQAALDKFNNV